MPSRFVLFRRALAALAVCALGGLVSGGPALAATPVQGVRVKAVYPHDAKAYTEGLVYLDGMLLESTGLVGQSTLRRVRLQDGAVVQSVAVPPGLFGEGMHDRQMRNVVRRGARQLREFLEVFTPFAGHRGRIAEVVLVKLLDEGGIAAEQEGVSK